MIIEFFLLLELTPAFSLYQTGVSLWKILGGALKVAGESGSVETERRKKLFKIKQNGLNNQTEKASRILHILLYYCQPIKLQILFICL